VDVLTNGYYRVFVANSQGVLSAPAFNKVTISITRVSDVVALTCATGGTCVVGDTGPGGGKVFYVHASGTFACGATHTSTCKYLEAAPNTWSGGSADPTKLWAIAALGSSDVLSIVDDDRSAYNNASGIGLGYKNSLAIVGEGNDTTTAAGAARAYRGGSQSDWYLPTTAELNLLCQWARNVTQSVTTACTGGTLNTGTGASGGFSTTYWSSSEYAGNSAWYQDFANGNQSTSWKYGTPYVRPVRAFGGTLTCADGGICAVGDTGPGGGVVFYVQASGGTFACGATLALTCKYLEAAPANWLTGTTGDPTRSWATHVNVPSNQVTAVIGARGTAIGSGYKNSLAIVAQTDNVAATSAAVEARAYRGPNSRTDWYLPTKNELNELFLERARVGGFTTGDYWSSSEWNDDTSWLQRFTDGSTVVPAKEDLAFVRPVRAF
jgi:hypothetical protein